MPIFGLLTLVVAVVADLRLLVRVELWFEDGEAEWSWPDDADATRVGMVAWRETAG